MFALFRLFRRVVALVVLAGIVYLAVTFGQIWLKARADDAEGSTSASDAIVVLGAAQYNGRPSPVLRARLDHAAALYKRRLAELIVVTGGQAVDDPSDETEARASARYLSSEHGIGGEVILWENEGCNTWESLRSTANELRKRGKVDVILVSDPFHSARIAAMADELDLPARVSPTRSSPIGGGEELKFMARETAVVAVGRVVGFRRLMGADSLFRSDSERCG